MIRSRKGINANDDISNNTHSTKPPNVKQEGLIVSRMNFSTVSQPSLVPSSRIIDIIHEEMIYGIARKAVAPDGTRLAMGGSDGEVVLVDGRRSFAASQLHLFQGPVDWVRTVSFSSDSSKLVVGWWDGTIIVFDARNGNKLKECKTPGKLNVCKFTNDGRCLVIGGVYGWNIFQYDKLPDNVEGSSFQCPSHVSTLDISKSGKHVVIGVCGGDERGCHIYSLEDTKECVRTLCKGENVWKVAIYSNHLNGNQMIRISRRNFLRKRHLQSHLYEEDTRD